MPRGDNARLSESSANTTYPYNQVWNFASGHQFQVDCSPNNERMFFQHARGTYVEINMDGNMVQMSVGDNVQYNKSGKTETTDENADGETHGHTRTITGGGTWKEYAGDMGESVSGNRAVSVMGNDNRRSKNSYTGVDKNSSTHVAGEMKMYVKGDMTIETSGTMTLKGSKITMNPSGGKTALA